MQFFAARSATCGKTILRNPRSRPEIPWLQVLPGNLPGGARAPRGGREKRSVVGSTLTIKGEVSGGEDLLIEGRIEGRLSLTGCSITVGREGRLKADLLAKTFQVDGFVAGTLQGEEWIRLSETGRVRGKLIAPRVILEEGCNFKGTIDMDASAKPSAE